MPGLTFSNELISRDEGLHTDFACCLYALLKHRLPEITAHTYGIHLSYLSIDLSYRIVREAVHLENAFCSEALPVSLVGINATLMQQYIQFVADRSVMLPYLLHKSVWFLVL